MDRCRGLSGLATVAVGSAARCRIPAWYKSQVADSISDLSLVIDRLRQFAAARSWERFHTPKNLAMALVVEAAELAEIFQWQTPEESIDVMASERDSFRVRDEIADVLAYLLQIADVCGVDPIEALNAKIDRNEERFAKNT